MTMFDGTKKFVIDKPIRLIELFGGYGSQHFALDYLGVKVEQWRLCEWAVKSIQAYKDAHFKDDNTDYSAGHSDEFIYNRLCKWGISANYNEPMTKEQIKRLGVEKQRQIYNNIKATHNLVNIQQAHGDDLGIVDTNKYDYLMTYSFPCVTADSLILTKDGYKEYADLQVGEYVLTKSNTWQKIAKKFDNGVHQTYFLQGMGFENIHCTANHKFYIRERYRKGHKGIRCFKEPVFKEAKDLVEGDYLGVPVIQEELPFYTDDLEFWYMIGYYLGDGWLASQKNDIILACNETKLEKLKQHLSQEKWHWTYHWNSSCYRFRFANERVHNFIQTYIGTGCLEKRICGEILMLPKPQLEALYNGYLDSDGCTIKKNIQFSSINRTLIYSIALIINKLFHRTACIYKLDVPSKTKIQGRIVNQHCWYQIRFKKENAKQDCSFYENGYLWYPFRKLIKAEKENVYNMEVENDHSYIIQGCISKNCQDMSAAGLGKGMAKGSGTRSGMLWEVERILDEIVAVGGELPQVLLMENVPEVIGTKNMPNFVQWRDKLEKIGYKCYWKVLNAKDYGVPQNRERCFMVSILGDYYYEFPQAIPLEHRLKDLLEDNVDEKYYLSDKAINGIENTKFNSASLENRTEKDGIMPTILARDYKDPKLVIEPKCEQVAQIYGFGKEKNPQAGRIYDSNGLSPTLDTCTGGNRMPKIIEPRICASRGRNPNNPSSRKSGEQLEQRLELGPEGVSNTLTTVQKDNYVIEPVGGEICLRSNNKRIHATASKLDPTVDGQYMDIFNQTNKQDISGASLAGMDAHQGNIVYNNYRIRKLTPKECGRLQGVKDDDIEKIQKNQSNASCYHLYGDSICVPVLMAIFSKMLNCNYAEYLNFEDWWKK